MSFPDRESFIKLQNKLVEASKQLAVVSKDHHQRSLELRYAQISKDELERIGSTDRIYETKGRMFVCSSRNEILERMLGRIDKLDKEVDQLKKKKEKMTSQYNETNEIFSSFIR